MAERIWFTAFYERSICALVVNLRKRRSRQKMASDHFGLQLTIFNIFGYNFLEIFFKFLELWVIFKDNILLFFKQKYL